MLRILTVPVWLCLILATWCSGAEVAVVHPGVPETTLTAERVRDLLLGRVTTWQDGSPVVIVLIEEPRAEAALIRLTGRDSARLLRGWKRLVYAGTGAMPLVIHGVPEGLATVAGHPGAIAVIGESIAGERWRCLPLPAAETR